MSVRHMWVGMDDDSGHAYIRSEMVSMSTSGRSICSDSDRSHLHTATTATRIEHRQQLVRYYSYFGMAVQPATEDMFHMLPASSGTTENAWLSDTGA